MRPEPIRSFALSARSAGRKDDITGGLGVEDAVTSFGVSDATESDRRTRLVRNLVEPAAGIAFFAPEVHSRYAALGFNDPGGEIQGVRQFDWTAYFAARAACMGEVSGLVAAAAFGVFPRTRVADAVDGAWRLTTPGALLEARLAGTAAAVRRLLEADPDQLDRAANLLDEGLAAAPIAGRPLFAGLRSLPVPDDPAGRWWRLCDQYREHRMDAHVAAFAAAGLDGCEACLLNDLRQGLGLGTYVYTRGWSKSDVAAAADRLVGLGLLADGALTPEGRQMRESLEAATDLAQSPIVDAMGDLAKFQELVGPWPQQIIDRYGYPGRRMVESIASSVARKK